MCVDEHKLLIDIERLLKRNLPRDVIPGYEPDPSIRAEPIRQRNNARQGAKPGPRNGAGQQRGNRARAGGAPAGKPSGARRKRAAAGGKSRRRPAPSSPA